MQILTCLIWSSSYQSSSNHDRLLTSIPKCSIMMGPMYFYPIIFSVEKKKVVTLPRLNICQLFVRTHKDQSFELSNHGRR